MKIPVKTKSGMLLTTQEEQLKRQQKYFSDIFNQNDNEAESKQKMRNFKDSNSENETEVNLDPTIKTEIQLALTQLENGKAAVPDNINPEVLNFDPEIAVELLNPLLKKMWKEEKIPEEWEEGIIIKIPKKRDISQCNN